MPQPSDAVRRYHDGSKHHFHRFARSLGHLDWASQPRPFRSFPGSRTFSLFPAPSAPATVYQPAPVDYDSVFDVRRTRDEASPRDTAGADHQAAEIGDLLRHALGLSAWKEYGQSRWALRVNPSSGNLHPTEAYIVSGPTAGLSSEPAVYHYAADTHALEERCRFDLRAWADVAGRDSDVWLVALTSIHWREAWKYGERAFRYCQHDLGHAVAALAVAARLVDRCAVLLPGWSHHQLAALTGVDRDEDFVDAEREEPGCLLALVRQDVPPLLLRGDSGLCESVAAGRWWGRASQLSEDHVQWTFIDEVAEATRWAGQAGGAGGASEAGEERLRPCESEDLEIRGRASASVRAGGDLRTLILQRRSAVAFDGRTRMSANAFFGMLARVMPGPHPPWDAVWWTPRVHLALFVHRVDGVEPGLYLLGRDEKSQGPERLSAVDRLRGASSRDFLWEPAHDTLPLVILARGGCAGLSKRLSCDQDIASDGCFSLGMIVEFERSLDEFGPGFYRHLYWETGIVGQVLYLEAEAAGVRSTGIGCFFDDPVHEALGLAGHAFQSLYHFTVGGPVEDRRLTTVPGYDWDG